MGRTSQRTAQQVRRRRQLADAAAGLLGDAPAYTCSAYLERNGAPASWSRDQVEEYLDLMRAEGAATPTALGGVS